MLPILDVTLFTINNNWLKQRNINPVKIMKPDWRYLACVSVGFINPRIIELGDWKIRYGQTV